MSICNEMFFTSSPVGRGSDGFLLANPRLFVFDVAEELLQTQRICQLLLPLLQRLLHGYKVRKALGEGSRVMGTKYRETRVPVPAKHCGLKTMKSTHSRHHIHLFPMSTGAE